MKYRGITSFNHQQKPKIGVLLTNLGTPDAPTTPALKRYLKQFLSDPRVVEVPKLIWWCILNFVILNIRPKRSARAYQTVWTNEGSPLLIHCRNQTDKIRQKLQALYGEDIVVEFAMRYGNPSISSVIDNMMQRQVTKLLVLPLYPQYSASTVASTFDAIAADFNQRRNIPELRFIKHYHDFPPYIKALAEKISAHWQQHGKAEMLMFSYHGVPKRYLTQGDPYHCECYKTTRLVAQYLNLQESEYMTSFQSRFGREEWLTPYTDVTLKELATKGLQSVQVICPGFSADCLETIEEICVENRDIFQDNGGTRFEYISALNSDDSHIDALLDLLTINLHGWKIADNSHCQAQALRFGAKQ